MRETERLRPYQEESTTSRLISEVKSLWAQSVPGLETTWEHWVLQSLFLFLLFLFVCGAASRLLLSWHATHNVMCGHRLSSGLDPGPFSELHHWWRLEPI